MRSRVATPPHAEGNQVSPPGVICEDGVTTGQFRTCCCVCASLCCACAWRRREPCFLELHRMLGTTEIGFEGLDAFFQMSRRQMSIS